MLLVLFCAPDASTMVVLVTLFVILLAYQYNRDCKSCQAQAKEDDKWVD
jgi:hypothetical protein